MPTVLLAEGDRDLRETYHAFLSRNGFQVKTANDGLQCLATLRHSVPDLLILDLELPWGGGDGVLGWLREDAARPEVSVILTATMGCPDVAPPVVEFLPKPFTLAALLMSIEGAVARKRAKAVCVESCAILPL